LFWQFSLALRSWRMQVQVVVPEWVLAQAQVVVPE
jgi:hypothetical protein